MRTKNIATLAAAAFMVLGSTIPAFAQSGRQKDKNLMRNLGIGLGSAAAYKTLKGDWKSGVVLGAGAAYSAKKYEDARKAQGRDQKTSKVYRYQNGRRIGYYKVRNGQRVGNFVRFGNR